MFALKMAKADNSAFLIALSCAPKPKGKKNASDMRLWREQNHGSSMRAQECNGLDDPRHAGDRWERHRTST